MRLAEEFARDARYALRGMYRAPGFACVAILTLALGIGANTAIFSVLYGVWLAPAPYAHADRLADFTMQQLSGDRFSGGTSYLNLADWKSQTRLADAFGVHQYTHQVNITGLGEAEEAIGHRVSANLFALLGAHPAVGRPIEAAADLAAGPRQALIAWSWWMRRFGGDPAIAGKQVLVDGEPFTITGVMPRGFEFPPMGSDSYRPVIWMSLSLTDVQIADRGAHSLGVVARLKNGVSLRRAQAEMDTIAARLAQAYPRDDGGWSVKVAGLTDGRPLEQVRPALVLLMCAAGLVLLIACANIASLLTARAAGREREMAVRRALGVTWQRLVRQLLTESAILALCGGCAGVLLAFAGLPLLKSVLPASTPRAQNIAVDGAVLAFAAAVSLLTGLLFGLVPAMRTQPLRRRNRSARWLVAAEVALALVLLQSSGLLLESFRRALHTDLGFQKEHVLTARLQLAKRSYPDGNRVRAFREELLSRVSALPGVQYAGTVSSLPMGMIGQGTDFEIAGRPETAQQKPFATYANVSTDYLRAMRIPLVSGRYFDRADGPGAPPVTIVSESLARAWWPAGAALGKRIRFDKTWFTIAGIVKDVRQASPEHAGAGHIYALNQQLPLASQGFAMGRFNVLVIRTASDTGAISAAVQRAVAAIDKNQPVAEITTMTHIVETRLESRRLNTLLLGMFAGLALGLAAVGAFGVASYAVARRTREIGIRMALGATPGSVMKLVVKENLLLAGAGAAIGFMGTAASSRLLARFLFGVAPAEPAILAAAALALIAVVAASGLFPARRAMRIDPIAALRVE
ncbi:MAG: ABC transporter permease [Candidatus Sulfopaludibacter sp.]|nr:ABC transporter permease [Candidatus Sulfopaludibacter sp.]